MLFGLRVGGRMGRHEYDVVICPKCGKKLLGCSMDLRREIWDIVGEHQEMSIHFMHKLLKILKRKTKNRGK
jgi:hypothetical protein